MMITHTHALHGALAASSLLLAMAPRAQAADTLEPFALGFSDGEMYLGADGLGPRGASRGVFAEAALGYGLADRLSAWVLWDLFADEHLGGGDGAMSFTIYGNALQAGPLGVDLMLEVGAGDPGFGQMFVHPGLELNLDAAPNQASWGFFLNAGLVLGGPDPAVSEPTRGLTGSLLVAPGLYWTVAPGHQLLAQIDVNCALTEQTGGARWDVGSLALGYNVTLGEVVELITEVSLDLPTRSGERTSLGFMVGFLATMPPGGGGS